MSMAATWAPNAVALWAAVALCASPVGGTEWFVAPNGDPNAVGTIGDPWGLESALLNSGGVNPGDAVGVQERLVPGMGRVGECDRLFRTLVEPEDGQGITEPRRDYEHHHEPEDGGDPNSPKGEERYQNLDPCGPARV